MLETNGYVLVKKDYSLEHSQLDISGEQGFLEIYKQCQPYSMTSRERMYALYKAVEYIAKNQIPGDIVECGVWKGGSSMLSALSLQKFQDTTRNIYLYDTYCGMSEPTDKDADYGGRSVADILEATGITTTEFCYASLSEVKENLKTTAYPSKQLLFVEGKVEDTIPQTLPKQISILRLDTDWYESTYHELCYLFPLLSVGGVIIIDDYGHWKGAKDATDQYIRDHEVKILLNRIDYTGRIGIKV